MVERGDEPSLRLKPLSPVGAIAKFFWKELQGDDAIEAGVPGPVHLAHASGAECRHNLVTVQAWRREQASSRRPDGPILCADDLIGETVCGSSNSRSGEKPDTTSKELRSQSAWLNEPAGQRSSNVLPAENLRLDVDRPTRWSRVLLRHLLAQFHRPSHAAAVLQRRDVEQSAHALGTLRCSSSGWANRGETRVRSDSW